MKPRRLMVTPRARRDIAEIAKWYRTRMGPRSANKVLVTLQAGLRAATTISLAAATRPDLPDGGDAPGSP